MDTFFFMFSKIFWIVFSPDSILVLLLVLCLFFFWFKTPKKALILLHFIVVSSILITFLPMGKWLLYPLETQFLPTRDLPEKIDGIIVLAGSERLFLTQYWQQVETNGAAERYIAFIHLIKKFPNAKHVFTGGIGRLNQNGVNSTDVARKLFSELQLNTQKIIFEDKSRNTFENAVRTKELVNPRLNEQWILITSASHMPRSMGIFYKLGWKVIPYPVDHKVHPERLLRMSPNFSGNLNDLKTALYEWIGLAAYYITGKTISFLPGKTLLKT